VVRPNEKEKRGNGEQTRRGGGYLQPAQMEEIYVPKKKENSQKDHRRRGKKISGKRRRDKWKGEIGIRQGCSSFFEDKGLLVRGSNGRGGNSEEGEASAVKGGNSVIGERKKGLRKQNNRREGGQKITDSE